jgi:hypothetical protein
MPSLDTPLKFVHLLCVTRRRTCFHSMAAKPHDRGLVPSIVLHGAGLMPRKNAGRVMRGRAHPFRLCFTIACLAWSLRIQACTQEATITKILSNIAKDEGQSTRSAYEGYRNQNSSSLLLCQRLDLIINTGRQNHTEGRDCLLNLHGLGRLRATLSQQATSTSTQA